MSNSRYILVVAVMATALCADRVLAGGVSVRGHSPHVGPTARQLAARLAVAFRRVLPGMIVHPLRRAFARVVTILRRLPVLSAPVHRAEITPFFFRLPPPRLTAGC